MSGISAGTGVIRFLVLASLVATDLQVVNLPLFGNTKITPDQAVILALGGLTFVRLFLAEAPSFAIRHNAGLLWRVGLFLLLAVIGTSFSPLFGEELPRAFMQVTLISAEVLALIGIQDAMAADSQLLIRTARVAVAWSVAIALIGLGQTVSILATGHLGLFDLTFLNHLLPGAGWIPAITPSGIRVNSILFEPMYFGLALFPTLPMALARLGLVGRRRALALKPVMTPWASLAILAGMIITASSIVYVGAAVMVMGHILLVAQNRQRILAVALRAACIGGAIAAGMIWIGWDEIQSRLQTFRVAGTVAQVSLAQNAGIVTPNASSWALLCDILVARTNLLAHPLLGIGLAGHPISYSTVIPFEYWAFQPDLYALNSEDADSLLLRLGSETGIVGTVAFLSIMLWAVRRCGRAVHEYQATWRGPLPVEGEILSGFYVSFLGVLAVCLLRLGDYHLTLLWIPLGLASIAPWMLPRLAAAR